MTMTTLHWMSNGISWYTPLDHESCRFIVTRQASSPRAPRFTLEQVEFLTRRIRKRTVVRQLRNIKSLDEAKRIAAEDWS